MSVKARIDHKGRASILCFTGKAVGQRRAADAGLRDRESDPSDVTEVRIQSPLPPNDKLMSSGSPRFC